MADRCRIRHARTPLRARLPALVVHHAAAQPSRRRVRRLAREPPALSAGSLRGRCARLGRRIARCRCASRRRIGSRAASPGRTSVEIARAFKAAGADLIDVSTGQTSPDARPVYGRMFQTPYADRIRNEVGIATMAVGNITDTDQVNAILAGGRADLVALGRPHLADPFWTLHAAARPRLRGRCRGRVQYCPGKEQLERLVRARRSGDAMSVAGKHALVTGGARGIGLGIAAALARNGARVSVVSRSVPEGGAGEVPRSYQRPSRRRRRSGGRARRSPDAAKPTVPSHILVNNAGIAESAPLKRTDRAMWDRIIATNLTGTFLCSREAVPGDGGRRVGARSSTSRASRACGRGVHAAVLREQTRRGRFHARDCGGTRFDGRDGECDLPGLHGDGDDARARCATSRCSRTEAKKRHAG